MITPDENYTVSTGKTDTLTVTMIGTINLEQVVSVLHQQWELGLRKSFWDLTEANAGQLSSEDIKKIASYIHAHRPDNFKSGAAAFLVSTALNFGMMRMVQAHSCDLGFGFRIEYERDLLSQWLEDLHLEPI